MSETFLYSGPATLMSLGCGASVRLHPNCPVSLDAKHPYVAALLERGLIARKGHQQVTPTRPKRRGKKVANG